MPFTFRRMQEEKEEKISAQAEQSVRKKLRKNIRCKFTDTCATCDNEENCSKRVEVKELIKEMKKTNLQILQLYPYTLT